MQTSIPMSSKTCHHWLTPNSSSILRPQTPNVDKNRYFYRVNYQGEHRSGGFQKQGIYMDANGEESLEYKKAKMGIVFTWACFLPLVLKVCMDVRIYSLLRFFLSLPLSLSFCEKSTTTAPHYWIGAPLVKLVWRECSERGHMRRVSSLCASIKK